MSVPPVAIETDALLAELDWVRSLARHIARDAHSAEDLAQDTMLVALRDDTHAWSREEPGALRRWLAAIARNLGRTRARSEQRRARREADAARPPSVPATDALVERASTLREVVDALVGLREPYRTTLLLRFFEDCSQREIAERMQVPMSTVGSRIADGLALLRRKVGRRDRSFAGLLASMAAPRRVGVGTALQGALLVSVQVKLLAAVLVVAVAWLVFQVAGGDEPVTVDSAAGAGPESASAAVPQNATNVRDAVDEEESKSEADGFHSIPAHAGIEFAAVRGRVVDLAGTPVANVDVGRGRPLGRWAETGELMPSRVLDTVRADAQGEFEIEAVVPFTLGVVDERYATVFERVVRNADDTDVLVIVAEKMPLGGVVVDEQGVPIAGARVVVQANVSRPGLDVTASRLVVPEARTDAGGAFSLAATVALEGATMVFRAPGFADLTRAIPKGGDPAMAIVMEQSDTSPYTIRGRVEMLDGRPAVDAHVSTGVMAVPTDAEGRFLIDFEPWLDARVDESAPTELTAIVAGYLPVTRVLPSVDEVRESGWPEDIVLRVDGEPLTMRGIVVDGDGEPVAGVLVEPTETTMFGWVPAARGPGGTYQTQEQAAGGGVARTGRDGRFELGGLLDRDYVVGALQRPSLLFQESEPVHASAQDVRIVLDAAALGTVAGRIVDAQGRGLERVRVSVSRKRVGELVIGSFAMTDADGRFALTRVTTTPAFLRIEGDAIVPELFRELGPDADHADLELVVGLRRRLQFEWSSDAEEGERVVVVDASGERLDMMRLSGNSIGVSRSAPYREGVSRVFVVSDQSAAAVVYRGEREIRRVRLSLRDDGVTVVRL